MKLIPKTKTVQKRKKEEIKEGIKEQRKDREKKEGRIEQFLKNIVIKILKILAN